MQPFRYIFILVFSLLSTFGCRSERPGPVPVVPSKPSITTVSELIQSRCASGADFVIQPLKNINMVPTRSDMDVVFTSHEFVNCKNTRKIRFTSLLYEMEARRIFPQQVSTPIDLVRNDQMVGIKRIMTSESLTPGISIHAEARQSAAEILIQVKALHGIPMHHERQTLSLIARFSTDRCDRPCVDTYLTRLISVEAVDADNVPLVAATIDSDTFVLHLSRQYGN
jgi:hypothetical protein